MKSEVYVFLNSTDDEESVEFGSSRSEHDYCVEISTNVTTKFKDLFK